MERDVNSGLGHIGRDTKRRHGHKRLRAGGGHERGRKREQSCVFLEWVVDGGSGDARRYVQCWLWRQRFGAGFGLQQSRGRWVQPRVPVEWEDDDGLGDARRLKQLGQWHQRFGAGYGLQHSAGRGVRARGPMEWNVDNGLGHAGGGHLARGLLSTPQDRLPAMVGSGTATFVLSYGTARKLLL